jgi:hypothetical protein
MKMNHTILTIGSKGRLHSAFDARLVDSFYEVTSVSMRSLLTNSPSEKFIRLLTYEAVSDQDVVCFFFEGDTLSEAEVDFAPGLLQQIIEVGEESRMNRIIVSITDMNDLMLGKELHPTLSGILQRSTVEHKILVNPQDGHYSVNKREIIHSIEDQLLTLIR